MSGAQTNPTVLKAVHDVEAWREENKELFAPPVCNKLMFKEQLNVMFVGGPNTRTDFHLDLGSEFFFQMKGNMELPTIQQGKRKLVKIRQGDVFLLPSRIPHSPQRPEEGSFGLVIERTRDDSEQDGLRWYTDFNTCDTVLWERYFHCGDLGRDLVPVVKAFKASPEAETMVPGDNVVPDSKRPWQPDMDTAVPDPFPFTSFLEKHRDDLANGQSISLFGDNHPDREFTVLVCGGTIKPSMANKNRPVRWKYDTWLYQFRGSARVLVGETETTLQEGMCAIVPPATWYSVFREPDSIGLVVMQDPAGNKGTRDAPNPRPTVERKA
eukprot:m.83215 g.83215  ORF g.83215 m.83215 type:complete len:325 (-) comp9523_c0_seq1:94-1068(-)